MKKNDIFTVDIVDNGINFEGIAKVEGITVFIPGAIIGENMDIRIIKLTSNYAIGKIENINKRSENRVDDTVCSVFKTCGGCESQHIKYELQLHIKTTILKNTLNRQGTKYSKLNNITGMGLPYYYRNKVQYPIRNVNGENKIGFYSKRSHNIVENKCCHIQNRVIDMLSKVVFDKLISHGFSGYNEENNLGDIRHIIIKRGYHTGEIMIVLVVNDKKLLKDTRFVNLVNELDKNNIKGIFLNLNSSKTNEILGEETICIYGEDYITDTIGGYQFYISPKSFFQVNTVQVEILYNILKEGLNLNKEDVLFDLYSGVGTIGIFLSENVKKVYGIEIEKEAVKMANLNISRNNVTNCEYIAGAVEDKIDEFKQRNIKPTVIVVDPPRRGLDEKSIQYILDFNPERIGYVSCNPATLARDLNLLNEKYNVESITPVDMFPQTHHIETIAILKLKK